MKVLISLLLAFGGSAALAHEVSFKCSPKAFNCGPNGACNWSEMYEGVVTTIPLDEDMNDQEIHRARYQTMLDGHQLTIDFRYNEGNQNRPLRVNAYLGATNVMAETSGTDKIDVALRNNTYGRGFVCTNIRVRGGHGHN